MNIKGTAGQVRIWAEVGIKIFVYTFILFIFFDFIAIQYLKRFKKDRKTMNLFI